MKTSCLVRRHRLRCGTLGGALLCNVARFSATLGGAHAAMLSCQSRMNATLVGLQSFRAHVFTRSEWVGMATPCRQGYRAACDSVRGAIVVYWTATAWRYA
jgi:hypothetical protein